MATYGLRIRDAAGNILLDTSDQISRVRYSNLVAAGASGSIELSDISGKTYYTFSIPAEYGKCNHTVTVSGTTLSWSPNSISGFITVGSSSSLIGLILVD